MQNRVQSSAPTVQGWEYYCDEHVKNDDGHAAASPERNPGGFVSGFVSLYECNSTDSESETNIRDGKSVKLILTIAKKFYKRKQTSFVTDRPSQRNSKSVEYS